MDENNLDSILKGEIEFVKTTTTRKSTAKHLMIPYSRCFVSRNGISKKRVEETEKMSWEITFLLPNPVTHFFGTSSLKRNPSYFKIQHTSYSESPTRMSHPLIDWRLCSISYK